MTAITCPACGHPFDVADPVPATPVQEPSAIVDTPAPADPVATIEQTVTDGEAEVSGAQKLLADLHQLETDLAQHGAGLVGILKSLIKDKLGVTL